MKTQQATVIALENQPALSPLDQLVRTGALRMLEQAIEAEVAAYIDRHRTIIDPDGRRVVVRNGYGKQCIVQTGAGPLHIRQPRGNDRREGQKFSSAILPPYLRRSKNIEALAPALYLRSASTAVASLVKDIDELLTSYDFPSER